MKRTPPPSPTLDGFRGYSIEELRDETLATAANTEERLHLLEYYLWKDKL